MTQYKQSNIEPKYVHQRQEIGFQQYTKYVPYSSIIDDMKMAFAGQIKRRINQVEFGSEETNEGDEMCVFRLRSWKMESIFDEKNEGPEYRATLELREGKAAERLIREKKVTDEKDLDRGYDIMRTWEIQNFLHQDWIIQTKNCRLSKQLQTYGTSD